MVGNHANGEAARHLLVNVIDAYETVLQESEMVEYPSNFRLIHGLSAGVLLFPVKS